MKVKLRHGEKREKKTAYSTLKRLVISQTDYSRGLKQVYKKKEEGVLYKKMKKKVSIVEKKIKKWW